MIIKLMKTVFQYFTIIGTILLFNACVEKPLNKMVSYETLTVSNQFKVFVNEAEVFVAKEEYFGEKVFNTAQFFVSGNTEIVVEASNGIESYEIRPRHLAIAATKEGNKLRFKVDKPQMLYITINEFEPLCLFQTPPEGDIPSRDDENVLYFSAGIHEPQLIRPKSNQTIYLEEGAIVKARIYGENVDNVTIKGRGIIDARGFTSKANKICGIEFKNSKNIKIEGVGLRTGEWWQSLFILCDNVEVNYINTMSFGLNNDGVDLDGVTNMTVKNSFIGCGDDGFGWHAVSAEENGQPTTKNCLVENCIIYNTHAGNGLRIGASMETELFEDITFKDITVLAYKNAAIRSDHSDWAMVKNLTFENFYIESGDRPVEIKIDSTRYSNSTGYRNERGHIDGLLFKNVTAPAGTYILAGADSIHKIENVSIIDCKIGGKVLSDTSEMEINTYVENVNFN